MIRRLRPLNRVTYIPSCRIRLSSLYSHPLHPSVRGCHRHFRRSQCNLHPSNGPLIAKRSFGSNEEVPASPLGFSIGSLNHGFPSGHNILRGGAKSDIRERLRKWENENVSQDSQPIPTDAPLPGFLANSLTRPQDSEFIVESEFDTLNDGLPTTTQANELSDGSNSSEYLSQGDLVELSSTGRQQQELAIYVRDVETQSQFYTMTGKYVHRNTKAAQFCVPGFVTPKELEEISKFLPTTDIPDDMRDKLHSFPREVPRDVGKPLIRKMLDFWDQSDAIYRAAAPKLDNAHEVLCHPRNFTYRTLESLAKQLLPASVPATDGRYSKEALYAVHRSLLNYTFGFRAQRRGNLRTRGIYELSPMSEVKRINDVVSQVRKYQEEEVLKRRGVEGDTTLPLERFAIKARRLIDRSRKLRPFTPHGVIGPSSMNDQSSAKPKSRETGEAFDNIDRNYINFFKSWAALATFDPTSFLHGIGSTILRAIGRYDDVPLDQTTAWTCLQEIGAIAPWENQATYMLRLQDREPRNIDITEDTMRRLRKDWGDLPVYCVDDVNAQEIDDGVSIELIESSREFWLHVHVADPAAHIPSSFLLHKRVVSMPQSIYMPERVIPMLGGDSITAHLSLAPNRPTLTFSARIDEEGNVLESKVTPGFIRNVKFVTPSTVNEILDGSSLSRHTSPVLEAGSGIAQTTPSRPLLLAKDLDDRDIANLRLLYDAGQVRRARRKRNGCLDQWNDNYSIAVSINDSSKKHTEGHSQQYLSDPSIKIVTAPYASQEKSKAKETIEDMMLLAGEIAAQFCVDRGLPVPYRLTVKRPDRPDPANYFQKIVLSELHNQGATSAKVKQEYIRLLQTTISTTPGPHVGIGLEKFVKCTSPLRRLTDLLVHWQIEATILEEARLGHSLVGNTREDFLPFSKDMLDNFIPSLDTRERMATAGMSDGQRAWLCHFLVRAWKFKEVKLPATFEFLVKKVRSDGIVNGIITDIPTQAHMPVPHWIDLRGINEGDRFKVELLDVCVYKRSITVNALERLDVSVLS